MTAMRGADSNAKVCAMLTTPGFWPDGVTNSQTSPQPWNQTVLTALGPSLQCVIVHYYPGGSSASGMLTDPADIAGIVAALHSEITQYAGISNAASIPILVTETNSTIDIDTQPAALFTADDVPDLAGERRRERRLLERAQRGRHDQYGGGATDYGDQGILSNASSSSGTTEPPAETPFAPYYALQMLSRLGSPGDELVTATSSNALVRVHAVRAAGGGLNVLIDNEDPTTPTRSAWPTAASRRTAHRPSTPWPTTRRRSRPRRRARRRR